MDKKWTPLTAFCIAGNNYITYIRCEDPVNGKFRYKSKKVSLDQVKEIMEGSDFYFVKMY
jgi:hypothetical protein